jgi:hypothetical protein
MKTSPTIWLLSAALLLNLSGDCLRNGATTDRISALEAELSRGAAAADIRFRALEKASTEDAGNLARVGIRTTCLRQTLEVLISTWPGRAALPEPCGSWPAWPMPGSSFDEIEAE